MNNDYIYIDENEGKSKDNTRQAKFKVSKTSKVEYLINEMEYDKALTLIDEMIDDNGKDYVILNLKAIIMDKLSEYEKSIEYFDKALELCENDEIKLNKSNALYRWAKITYFPKGDYEKALKLINDALKSIPKSEDPSEYYFLKGEILEALGDLIEAKKSYLVAYKEFDKLDEFEKQTQYLNETNDVLINITGGYYYNFSPNNGQIVELVQEPDNEHDPDAIAVYLDGEKVGYVANSTYTLFKGFKNATQIKGLNPKKAVILFVYLDEYIVAKLLDS